MCELIIVTQTNKIPKVYLTNTSTCHYFHHLAMPDISWLVYNTSIALLRQQVAVLKDLAYRLSSNTKLVAISTFYFLI